MDVGECFNLYPAFAVMVLQYLTAAAASFMA